MSDGLARLSSDIAFCKLATKIKGRHPVGQVEPLDSLFQYFQQFTAVRRREARVALLRTGGRVDDDWLPYRNRVPGAIVAFNEAINVLTRHLNTFQPLVIDGLDDAISLAADHAHPLHAVIGEAALKFGFAKDESEWLFAELKKNQYRPVEALCAGDYSAIGTLLDSLSAGECGLLVAGFPRFTGDAQRDGKLRDMIGRLQGRGSIPSVFLLLAIVLAAHAVASAPNSN